MNRIGWMRALAPALFVVAIGCGGHNTGGTMPAAGSSDTAEAQPPPANTGAGEVEDESTADLAAHHRHHSHGGFPMFIAMSLDSVGATPDQEAKVHQIQSDLFAKLQPARDAEKAVILALADQVQAGQVDREKLKPLVEQLGVAAGGVHDAVADTLNDLHATLNESQRVALVDKVEANLEVWHHVNSADEPAEKDEHGGHLGHLAKEYGLSHDQVEQIRTTFLSSITQAPKYDQAEAEAHMKAFGQAFEGDHFNAKELTTGAAVNGHMATWGVHRMIHFYAAVAPVLTPEQRAKVADALRQHANYKTMEG